MPREKKEAKNFVIVLLIFFIVAQSETLGDCVKILIFAS